MTTPFWRALCDRRAHVLSVTALALVFIPSAEARPRHSGEGSVVACSHYGKGCVRGPVRHGPVGLQVRMPGGTWIGCKRSCRRTLREEALDFFETMNERIWDR